MINLALREIVGSIQDIIEIVSTVELNNYGDGRFQNGPAMVEFKPTEITNSDQTFKVYIPINEEVAGEGNDGVNWLWIPELDIEKVLRSRVPFDDGIDTELENMKSFLQKRAIQYEDRLILLFSKIYEEYWVDMVIPYV
jgi:hypothetical protein